MNKTSAKHPPFQENSTAKTAWAKQSKKRSIHKTLAKHSPNQEKTLPRHQGQICPKMQQPQNFIKGTHQTKEIPPPRHQGQICPKNPAAKIPRTTTTPARYLLKIKLCKIKPHIITPFFTPFMNTCTYIYVKKLNLACRCIEA